MDKRIVFFCLAFLTLIACQLSAQTTPEPVPTLTPTPIPPDLGSTKPAYPLAEGAYWVYQGEVAYQQDGDVVEETIQWRVEVAEEVSRPPLSGYRMRGSLYDLAFYSPGTQPSEYAVLQVGNNRFYTADLEAYARLKTEDDFLFGLVSETNLFLELPLEAGNRFCEAEQITRLDGSYCWVVGEPEMVTLPFLPDQTVQAYPLSYSTNPDFTQLYFAPGIGIVAFGYRHHGSASEVQVGLIEYSPGKEGP